MERDSRWLLVEELNAFVPEFQLSINTDGMLQYGKDQTRIAEDGEGGMIEKVRV